MKHGGSMPMGWGLKVHRKRALINNSVFKVCNIEYCKRIVLEG